MASSPSRLDSLDLWRISVEEHLAGLDTSVSKWKVLYINDKEDIQQFNSPEEAKKSGFTKVAPIARLIFLITREIFKQQGSATIDSLIEARNLLRSLLHRQLHIQFAKDHPNIKLVFDKAAREQSVIIAEEDMGKVSLYVPQAEKLLAQLKYPQGNVISLEMLSLLANNIDKVSRIKRSVGGHHEGVYFLDSDQLRLSEDPKDRLLVVKVLYNPTRCVFADRFFLLLGFFTPHYGFLHRDHIVGKRAFAMLRDFGQRFFDELSGQAEEEEPPDELEVWKGQFGLQMKQEFITVCDRVPGTSFSQVTATQAKRILNNKTLEAIGRMIFLDAFIGNGDRLTTSNFNNGNIMLIRNSDEIALIDHEFTLLAESFPVIMRNVQALLEPYANNGTILAIAQMFIDKMYTMKSLTITAQQVKLVQSCFSLGIHTAARDLLSVFKESHSVDELLELPKSLLAKKKDFKLDPRSFKLLLLSLSDMVSHFPAEAKEKK